MIADVETERSHLAGHGDPVLARHVDIEHGDMRAGRPNQVQRLLAIRGFADDQERTIGGENLAQTLAEDRMVVGDDDADVSRSVASAIG